ncbi:hypothetical protein HPP92_024718 [Vanilla planifolia]|uniref:Uncharacterized protein n=1 Tax=Vanilla planifolia TaxID=51239 RepID=A0A835U8C3_VANPL|nr:hypothetical protein HPP92_024718 [Vanilla planifolia]
MRRSHLPVSAPMESTSCDSLLQELQVLWDEIGENELERDKIILQLEQECLGVYRRKVEQERKHKDALIKVLSEREAEVSKIMFMLGEEGNRVQVEQKCTLKEQLSKLKPLLEDLRRRKEERLNELLQVQSQIVHISAELMGNFSSSGSMAVRVDDQDLTLKRLGELKCQLLELHKEKTTRLQKVNAHIKTIVGLCSVLGFDCNEMLLEVHPSFVDDACESKSISNDSLARLAETIHSLKQEKTHRMQKVQRLGNMLVELWNLMETRVDEQKKYDQVTSLIAASADDVLDHGQLAISIIEQTELEVERLNGLKVTKMKELVFKKQNELEEICRGAHMNFDSDAIQKKLVSIINSGEGDLSELLSDMDNQISLAQEQAVSRKDILERVERWRFAFHEESWLDEYERDQNRYTAVRGAHVNLKRAEKARAIVSKIPSLVETLTAKVKAWENEKGLHFFYDKKSLLETLEEYISKRQQREDEKRKFREQKRLQEQYATEQEALFGRKSSPIVKKPLAQSNLNMSMGTPNGRRFSTHLSRPTISSNSKEKKDCSKVSTTIPLNYVALSKDG